MSEPVLALSYISPLIRVAREGDRSFTVTISASEKLSDIRVALSVKLVKKLKFRVKTLNFSSGKPLVVLDDEAAADMGVRPHERVSLRFNSREVIALVNVAWQIPRDIVLVNDEVVEGLGVEEGDYVEVELAPMPDSLRYIRDLLRGARLGYDEIKRIVEDIVEDKVSEVELTALVTAIDQRGMGVDEAYYFSLAMVETGEVLDLGVEPILDKHSIGGVPGDKTSLILVPVIASLGYYIPKTSSRAITSPAGTADRAEVLMPVTLSLDEMREVVLKTRGCIVWGGALHIAPADDKIIRVEYPLSIDPFLVPSIMAKKKAVGSTHVVIDIPVGRGAKVKTIGEAHYLAREIIEVGRRLGIEVACALTVGEQPVGYTAGPVLEAREALETLMGRGPRDLVDKVTSIAGVLLEMIGVERGKQVALEAIRSGRALAKLREIIEAQGGDPNVRPEDLPTGEHTYTVRADRRGVVMWINNKLIASLARAAGAPKDRGAGIELHVKLGDNVEEGAPLLTIYREYGSKLQAAEKLLEELKPIGVGRPESEMLIEKVPTLVPHERLPIIER
ncbi:MAG: AMP phosphorylase [Thermoprotei archaeon]|nr:MAG: AMP phosphorylase [Thermoprotei archaeon]